MVSGVRCQENTEVSAQKADDSRKKTGAFLSSVICLLTPDTRHLKPVLLKKKIGKNDRHFVNYLRNPTLGKER